MIQCDRHAEIAVVEHGSRVQHDLKDQDPHRRRPQEENHRDFDEHGERDLHRGGIAHRSSRRRRDRYDASYGGARGPAPHGTPRAARRAQGPERRRRKALPSKPAMSTGSSAPTPGQRPSSPTAPAANSNRTNTVSSRTMLRLANHRGGFDPVSRRRGASISLNASATNSRERRRGETGQRSRSHGHPIGWRPDCDHVDSTLPACAKRAGRHEGWCRRPIGEAARSGYRTGRTGFLDVIEAERTLWNSG